MFRLGVSNKNAVNEEKVNELVGQIRELWGLEKTFEALFNQGKSKTMSYRLKESVHEKDMVLTALMSLHMSLAERIAKKYACRAKWFGLSAVSHRELYEAGAEAMVLEIATQKWLSSNRPLTPLLKETMENAVEQRMMAMDVVAKKTTLYALSRGLRSFRSKILPNRFPAKLSKVSLARS